MLTVLYLPYLLETDIRKRTDIPFFPSQNPRRISFVWVDMSNHLILICSWQSDSACSAFLLPGYSFSQGHRTTGIYLCGHLIIDPRTAIGIVYSRTSFNQLSSVFYATDLLVQCDYWAKIKCVSWCNAATLEKNFGFDLVLCFIAQFDRPKLRAHLIASLEAGMQKWRISGQ